MDNSIGVNIVEAEKDAVENAPDFVRVAEKKIPLQGVFQGTGGAKFHGQKDLLLFFEGQRVLDKINMAQFSCRCQFAVRRISVEGVAAWNHFDRYFFSGLAASAKEISMQARTFRGVPHRKNRSPVFGRVRNESIALKNVGISRAPRPWDAA